MSLTVLHVGAALVYLLASTLLFIFGANLIAFSALVIRRDRRSVSAPPPPTDLPRVTVQLPIYNELYVSERLITAACALDYPRERLQIQVLDDSTDETVVLVAQAVEQARNAGIDIVTTLSKNISTLKRDPSLNPDITSEFSKLQNSTLQSTSLVKPSITCLTTEQRLLIPVLHQVHAIACNWYKSLHHNDLVLTN